MSFVTCHQYLQHASERVINWWQTHFNTDDVYFTNATRRPFLLIRDESTRPRSVVPCVVWSPFALVQDEVNHMRNGDSAPTVLPEYQHANSSKPIDVLAAVVSKSCARVIQPPRRASSTTTPPTILSLSTTSPSETGRSQSAFQSSAETALSASRHVEVCRPATTHSHWHVDSLPLIVDYISLLTRRLLYPLINCLVVFFIFCIIFITLYVCTTNFSMFDNSLSPLSCRIFHVEFLINFVLLSTTLMCMCTYCPRSSCVGLSVCTVYFFIIANFLRNSMTFSTPVAFRSMPVDICCCHLLNSQRKIIVVYPSIGHRGPRFTRQSCCLYFIFFFYRRTLHVHCWPLSHL